MHFGGTMLDTEAMQTVFQYQMDGCIITSAPISPSAAEICARAGLPMLLIEAGLCRPRERPKSLR